MSVSSSKQPGNDANDANLSVKGVSHLIIVQIIAKLLTFVLNQLIIRYLSPSIIGVTTYLNSFVRQYYFQSRINQIVQRVRNNLDNKDYVAQKVVNFGILAIAFAFLFSWLLGIGNSITHWLWTSYLCHHFINRLLSCLWPWLFWNCLLSLYTVCTNSN